MLHAQATDQRECPRDLQAILERERFIVDPRRLLLRRQQAVVPAGRIDQRDLIVREIGGPRSDEIKAACGNRRHQAVVHAGDVRIPGQVGEVAGELLAVRHVEALPVDQVRIGIERLDLVVEPFALRAIAVSLAPQRQAGRELELETAAQPHLLRHVAIVEDVVVGVEGTIVDRDRARDSIRYSSRCSCPRRCRSSHAMPLKAIGTSGAPQ